MKGRYARHSKVMTIANHLVKQGYNRAYAMVKAWALVKLSGVTVKVAGVTYGKRQTRTPSPLLSLYVAKEPILWVIFRERSRRLSRR